MSAIDPQRYADRFIKYVVDDCFETSPDSAPVRGSLHEVAEELEEESKGGEKRESV